MNNQSHKPRGCLAFLFGFGGSRAAGGYATDYRADHEFFDVGHVTLSLGKAVLDF